MKFKSIHTMAAAAVVALIAGCGGGGGGSTPTLEVSGTAATGAALASAAVEVKCAAGTGTATTTSTGSYTVTMENGALPCIIKVSGTVGALPVTLHSVTEAGSDAGDSRTSAKANVTPVTEMIVAQLTAALPSDSFAAFNPGLITAATVASASSAIVSALKTVGIDLTTIGDPLKAELVPPIGTTAGNAYDTLLELLGQTVTPESLPLVVNQIAVAASAGSTEGLTTAIIAVSGGALENCPQALSGKYRTIEYTGATEVHTVDFKARTWTTEGSSQVQTITPSSTQPCEFAVGDAKVVIGPQGAGAFVAPDITGYVVPVQAHALSAAVGTWNYVEAGLNESNAGENWMGKFTINADGSASACDYNVMSGSVSDFNPCVTDTAETVTARAAADGGIDLQYGTVANKVYGYKAPNGVLTLFGTSNAGGSTSPTALRTHFIMTRAQAATLPAVGTSTKNWDLQLFYSSGVLRTDPLIADSQTVTAVDTATGSVTRERASDGRVTVTRFNYPAEGVHHRAASSTASSIYVLPLQGLGINAVIDNMASHFYVISMQRP